MANSAQRLPSNAPGDFFVDGTCIDCDQCREIAPRIFGDAANHASVSRQPDTPALLERGLRALVACPVGAIGTERRHDLKAAVAGFPEKIDEEVYFCGFASRSSYGASSYFIVRPEGNVLVDSPRFAARLVRRLEDLGGVRWMFLSHIDDIADHALFQRHFGCERVMHRQEVRPSMGDIEWQPEGDDALALGPGLLAIPTPGHTRGHMVLLYRDRYLFSGDHVWWSKDRQRLSASRSYCWYDWNRQIQSMERLLQYRFEWVLPGHGQRRHAPSETMRRMLSDCVDCMRKA